MYFVFLDPSWHNKLFCCGFKVQDMIMHESKVHVRVFQGSQCC